MVLGTSTLALTIRFSGSHEAMPFLRVVPSLASLMERGHSVHGARHVAGALRQHPERSLWTAGPKIRHVVTRRLQLV
jgi:hypothetical protein